MDRQFKQWLQDPQMAVLAAKIEAQRTRVVQSLHGTRGDDAIALIGQLEAYTSIVGLLGSLAREAKGAGDE